MLEDLGFFVIDNLPPTLIAKVAELARGTENADPLRARRRRALAATSSHDLSAARSTSCATTARTRASSSSTPSDDVLVRRYEASRRRHPLSDSERVSDGIARERALLEELKGEADIIVDTSSLNVHELRDRLRELSPTTASTARLQINIVSFGYKHGLPLDVDLVFDCRFLPNPHWIEELRPLTGLDAACATTCSRNPRPRRSSRARPPVRADASRLRAGRQGVPVDRRRLHRRPPPQRRDRGRARRSGLRRPRLTAPSVASPRRRPRRLSLPCDRSVVALGGGHGLAVALRAVARVRGRDHRGRERRRRRRQLRPAAARPRRRRARRPPQVPRRARERRRPVGRPRSSTASSRRARGSRARQPRCSSGSPRRSATSRPRSTRPAGCSARSGACCPRPSTRSR